MQEKSSILCVTHTSILCHLYFTVKLSKQRAHKFVRIPPIDMNLFFMAFFMKCAQN